jgi:Rrf2 family protein
VLQAALDEDDRPGQTARREGTFGTFETLTKSVFLWRTETAHRAPDATAAHEADRLCDPRLRVPGSQERGRAGFEPAYRSRDGDPEGFLPRVLGDLADAGIVGSQLGRSGGYWLQLSPDNLSVLNLIEIVEGPSRSDTCVLRQRACDGSRPCAFHPVWDEAQTAFINVLATTTLAELAASGVGGTASHRGTT